MALPADLIHITKDIAPTLYGVPTQKQTIVGVVVFIAFILIWVGSSMMLGYLFTGYGDKKTYLGHGGVVVLAGLSVWTGAKLYDHFKS
jgi:hypothetical protein